MINILALALSIIIARLKNEILKIIYIKKISSEKNHKWRFHAYQHPL